MGNLVVSHKTDLETDRHYGSAKNIGEQRTPTNLGWVGDYSVGAIVDPCACHRANATRLARSV